MGIPVECGDETNWTAMMRIALNELNKDSRDYFVFLHEDYWLVDKVETMALRRFLYLMDRCNIDHIQLCPSWDVMISDGPFNLDSSLMWVDQNSSYRTSNQASLWKTRSYRDLLHKGESAWDFEVCGSHRARNMSCLSISAPHPYWPIKHVYRHLREWDLEPIVKGRWTADALKYCQREDLEVNFEVGGKVLQ